MDVVNALQAMPYGRPSTRNPADREVVIDVTFPGGDPWDGDSSMQLGCGNGEDYPAGADADADKRALEQRFCDPAVREPFIAALGHMSFNPRPPA